MTRFGGQTKSIGPLYIGASAQAVTRIQAGVPPTRLGQSRGDGDQDSEGNSIRCVHAADPRSSLHPCRAPYQPSCRSWDIQTSAQPSLPSHSLLQSSRLRARQKVVTGRFPVRRCLTARRCGYLGPPSSSRCHSVTHAASAASRDASTVGPRPTASWRSSKIFVSKARRQSRSLSRNVRRTRTVSTWVPISPD